MMPATVKTPPIMAALRVRKVRKLPPRRSVLRTLSGVSSNTKEMHGTMDELLSTERDLKYCVTEN